MKKSTTHHTIVLPLLAAGILAGVAEAASSGVRIHRIGDPPMLPRNFIIQGHREAEPAAPAKHTAPAAPSPERTAHAVPMAPIGQEVGSAPVLAPVPVVPVLRGDQVPLAPVQTTPRPAMNYNQHIIAPEPEPTPEPELVREAEMPLSPTRTAEPEPEPTMVRRSRLPLAPAGFVPAPLPAPRPAVPMAAAAVPQPVVVTPPAPKPAAAPPIPEAPKPAAAPARRRLPIAPVGSDPDSLPPVPSNLLR